MPLSCEIGHPQCVQEKTLAPLPAVTAPRRFCLARLPGHFEERFGKHVATVRFSIGFFLS